MFIKIVHAFLQILSRFGASMNNYLEQQVHIFIRFFIRMFPEIQWINICNKFLVSSKIQCSDMKPVKLKGGGKHIKIFFN